ncbi:MAG: dihydrofolate reductase [Clostridiales bacterium]|nr:dihydrofolate reductase [Clostridiales bacterium]
MATIIVTYGVPRRMFDEKLAGHQLLIPQPMKAFTKEEMLRLLPEADAVVACTAFDAEMIQAAKKLKLIVCYGAGYDAIDVEAATRAGIMVANTPDCVTMPTAELAMALIMSLARRIVDLNDKLHTQPSQQVFGMGKYMGTSLAGRTLGIVGMGRIGSLVADFGRFIGMQVLYTARTPKPHRDALGDRQVSLPELMQQADFVSLHCPATPETRQMISREMLSLMKPTAYLINTARGAVVDEEALIQLLRDGSIAGAGLDVYQNEPNPNPDFLTLPNVILTPHVGSNTLQARDHMAEQASLRILDVLGGNLPQNLLNPEALNT